MHSRSLLLSFLSLINLIISHDDINKLAENAGKYLTISFQKKNTALIGIFLPISVE